MAAPCLCSPPPAHALFPLQIDWGDFGMEPALQATDAGISTEAAGIDWGISLESDPKVRLPCHTAASACRSALSAAVTASLEVHGP